MKQLENPRTGLDGFMWADMKGCDLTCVNLISDGTKPHEPN